MYFNNNLNFKYFWLAYELLVIAIYGCSQFKFLVVFFENKTIAN
jgi:hypothetical protein